MKKSILIVVLSIFFTLSLNAEKRNVLLIAIDDLRPELGCYGKKEVISPNIDKLAARGVRFDHAYTQQAVCGPSRVTLLSGTRPDGNWHLPKKFFSKDLPSLPHYLRMQGYKTYSIGKLYHHNQDDPDGFDVGPWNPWDNFDSWQSYVGKESKEIKKQHQKEHKSKSAGGPLYECLDVDDSAYPDGMTADKAIAHMRELKGDKPFFMAVGFVKPHLPFNAPKKYWDMYDPNKIELPTRTTPPDHVSPYGRTRLETWPEMRNYAGVPETGPVSDELTKKLIHGYRACISHVDAQVGRLIAELDKKGLKENTLIIIWGDHGFKLGEYGAWVKHTNFEIDTRIPLIVVDPKAKVKGVGSEALVETVDVAPTIASWCGLEIPKHWEGSSVTPLLNSPNLTWKEAAFSQYRSTHGKINAMGRSIRTKDFRYVEWTHKKKGIVAQELYDHRTPGLEVKNLSVNPEYKDTLKKLSTLLDNGHGWRKVRSELSHSH
jgi:iduronate 2-sulfatase